MQALTLADSILLVAVCCAAALLGVVLLRRREASGGQFPSEEAAAADDLLHLAPYPIWTCDANGTPTRTNASYRRLQAASADNHAPVFPFSPDGASGPVEFRAQIHSPAQEVPEDFDVTLIPAGDGWYGYARPITGPAEAGAVQKEFTQTLAKTFAQLSTGLAIFDAQKRLQLFNPALVDLCGLPVDFLTTRPDLATFFDRLRDGQMMPEPRDYADWRSHIAELAEAAASGRYQETWTLASGSVYEVIGRPHPGGATAFLFQDISAEVSLTRQFRSDLELNQAILDALDDAVCVISEAGMLTYANPAYDRFWHCDASARAEDQSIGQAAALWRAQSVTDPGWSGIRDMLMEGRAAPVETCSFTLPGDRRATCSLTVLPGGATLFQFRETPGQSAAPARIAETV